MGMSVETLVDLLRARAQSTPDKTAVRHLSNGETEDGSLTFSQLEERSRAVAAVLLDRKATGHRVALVHDSAFEFLPAFFGCLFAGALPIPLPGPRLRTTLPRISAVLKDSQPLLVLSETAATERIRTLQALNSSIDWVDGNEIDVAIADTWRPRAIHPDTLACLQYTSGSTRMPAGVMLSHRNFLANLAAIRQCFGTSESSENICWLPHYHDMGLVGGLLAAIECGGTTTLLPPAAFIQRPIRWLQAISRFAGTHSGAPNFAYSLCARQVSGEQLDQLDLSSWRVAFCGAEPVRSHTLRAFVDRFTRCGFSGRSFLPCYGLAEATLLVAGKPHESAPTFHTTDEVAGPSGARPAARELVSSGLVVPGHSVIVVDPMTGERCSEGVEGELLVAGPSVAAGYWGKHRETTESFFAKCAGESDGRHYLKTGDLGQIIDGELFVTGRCKDLLIIRGQNHHPQDIEATVAASHPAIDPYWGAAISNEFDGEERLVIVHELLREHRGHDPAPIVAAIRAQVGATHDVEVFKILLLRPGRLPRTSSGKVARQLCRIALLDGSLEALHEWTAEASSERSAAISTTSFGAIVGKGTTSAGLQEQVQAVIARRVGCAPSEVDPRTEFAHFGIGSAASVSLAAELEDVLQRRLSPTLLYEFPTLEKLTEFLSMSNEPPAVSRPIEGPSTARVNENSDDDAASVAIVGIGCRFPGASNRAEFWSLLRNGVDAIRERPDRDWAEHYQTNGAAVSLPRRGGFLDELDRFDADFFGISPREAIHLDPQQRLLLEVAWEAFEDAGIPSSGLRGTEVGAFVGISTNDYRSRHRGTEDACDLHSSTGNALSIAANRLSYFFDWTGPSMAIDTACSSSLVAVHLACRSIAAGECHLAVAGGVNLILSEDVTEAFNRARFLAPDGRCKAFDARADGYARGEGAGVVVLKRLRDAIADGDRVYAVIRGTAVNQDGRSNGLTAPNPQSQRQVIQAACRRAGIEAKSLQYVEAHGTGTSLGDPLEVKALGAVVAPGRDSGEPCLIGSVKTNIGHLEAAAGAAGLIKTALMIHHGTIVPSLNFEQPNPLIPFGELPLAVAVRPQEWPAVGPVRIAGVSSFGFGGTNAHAILTSTSKTAQQIDREVDDGGKCLLPISAKTDNALLELVRAYKEHLGERLDTASFWRKYCIAAATNRDHHERRLAIIARSTHEAVAAMEAYLANRATADIAPDASGTDSELISLKRRYEAGKSVDWQAYYGTRGPVIALPHYTWQRKRFWLGSPPPSDNGQPLIAAGESLDDGGGEIGEATAQRASQDSVPKFPSSPAGLSAEGVEGIRAYLCQRVAAALRYEPGEIDSQRPLTELGMDSLTAVELVHDVETNLKVRISFDQLLDGPSIHQLAEVIVGQLHAAEDDEPIVASAADIDLDSRVQRSSRWLEASAPVPLSTSQERLWLLAQLAGSEVLNIPAALKLSGRIDVPALEGAVNDLYRRHEMLRATFVQEDDQVVQHIQPATQVSLHVLHLSPMSLEENRREAKRLMTEAARQPFDFATGPVFRIMLLRLSDTEHYLQLVVSHLVADGWSVALLIRELAAFYRSRLSGQPAALEEIKQNFTVYAREQRRESTSDVGRRNREYWVEQLAGSQTSIDLPIDKTRPAVRTQRGRRRYFTISAATSQRLAELSREHGLTPFMTLLAAYQTLLGRCTGQEDFIVGTPSAGRGAAETDNVVGVYMTPLPIHANLAGDPTFVELMSRVRDSALGAYRHSEVSLETLIDEMHLATAPGRAPLFQVLFELQDRVIVPDDLPALSLELMEIDPGTSMLDLSLHLAGSADGYRAYFEYNSDLFDPESIDLFAERFGVLIEGILADPARRLSELPVLSEREQDRLLNEWNETATAYDREICIHELFEQQARRTPHATALVFQRAELSYHELDARSNQLARRLIKEGVKPEMLIGLCVERSLEMVVGMLGILKAGAAYVPVDPTHPADRQRLILDDSQARIVLSQRRLSRNLPKDLTVVNLDSDWAEIAQESSATVSRDESRVSAKSLAYVLYTSGSTGRPKGVMITHRNVVNHFRGISQLEPNVEGGTFLAVTTISFDISVMELLWPLSAGFRVIIAPDQRKSAAPNVLSSNRPPMDFSLFYFECDEKQGSGGKYDLVLEGAKFADENQFAAIWTPERHFHPFGGLYPNPAVVMSAVAATTRHIGIRAGSVVLPLHNPIRVAEEWSVVDNLSNGRVGIAFASGSHPNDFVFAPDNYTDRKDWMLREIETVRRLWRGESVRSVGGNGAEVEIEIFPRPVQSELPVWLTCIGLPSFQHAGEHGYNVLTHLLFHDVRDLTEKIVTYRRARRAAGHSGSGHVTLMVHTFVGENLPQVRNTVYEPLTAYLRSSADLFIKMGLAQRFNVDVSRFDKDDLEAFVEQAFERFFDFNGLLGTPETCATMVETLRAIGVDEVACLIDFGIGFDDAMQGLVRLNDVRQRTNRPLMAAMEADSTWHSLGELILRHDVTHFQCTPTMARLLLSEPRGPEALARLKVLYVGGDTLPAALAKELLQHLTGRLHNMYGPTETTIWSTSAIVERGQSPVPIGRPLANTQVYVLDTSRRPVPIGVAGELYIGGDGVARGYWDRPELTQERFPADPFQQEAGRRMYRTGDQVRYRSDGVLEYVGRLDHQVKVRGHRIELGEIETVLAGHPDVKEAVVLARTDSSGEKQLVGFVRGSDGALEVSGLRSYLRERLPDYMVPAGWTFVEAFPLTPNNKIDRKALLIAAAKAGAAGHDESYAPKGEVSSACVASMPIRAGSAATPRAFVKWRTNTERTLVQLWRGVLETDREIGVHDNFFDLGGHSLQAVMLVTRIRAAFGVELALRDFFEAADLAALAARIDSVQR